MLSGDAANPHKVELTEGHSQAVARGRILGATSFSRRSPTGAVGKSPLWY